MADEGFECFEYLESALSKIIDNSNLNSIEYLGLKSQHIKGKFVRFDKESNIELLTKPENESVIQFDKLQINSVIDNSISSIKGSVSKILKILEKAGVEASFIEISIFDQKDVLGNKFVTFLFASTFEAINKYRDEMEGNMPDNRESGRGLIVPCDTFYNFSYLHSNHNVDKTKIEKIDTDNIYAFIGNYNPSSDPVEGKKITKYTRKFLEDVLENIVTEPKKSNSQSQRDKSEHYIGIAIPISRPVGLNVFLESKDRQKLPEKLKGGALFVYGRKKLKRLNISKLVLDLKREYLDKAILKSAVPMYEHVINSKDRAANIFGHETKHLFGALQTRWMLEPEQLFNLSYEDSKNSEKLGRIEVWEKDIFDRIRIVPDISFIDTMRGLVFLWTGQYDPNDIPFKVDNDEIKAGLSIDRAISLCWDFCKDVMSMSILFHRTLGDVNTINTVNRLHDKFNEFYGNIEFINESSLECKLIFQQDGENTFKKPMIIIQLFQSILLNVIKHFDPSKGCKVIMSETAEQKIIIRIINYELKNENKEIIDKKDVVERIVRRTGDKRDEDLVNTFLNHIEDKAKTIAQNLSGSVHTEEVINSLLNEINGRLIDFNDKQKLGESHTIFEFNLD